MTPAALFSLNSDLPIKVLAVAGGAALGGLVIGWLVQVLARMYVQNVPRLLLGIVRTVSAVACGLLVYLWVFGSGGGGWGGRGGFGLGGSGSGKDSGEKKANNSDGKGKERNAKAAAEGEKAGQALTVEVLGDEPLQKIATKQGSNLDKQRRYQISEGGKKKLLGKEEVRKIIRERRQDKEMPLREITVVVYKDSPAREAWVGPLKDLARELGSKEEPLRFKEESIEENAPVD